MTTRAEYYRRRRQRLRRRHMCTRCGTEPAESGHTMCPGCLEIKKAKRPDAPAAKKKLERRLAALDAARERILERFTRVA